MNNYKKIKTWLWSYREAKFMAESLWRQAKEWLRTIYEPSCQVLDGLPHGGSYTNKTEKQIIKHLELIDEADEATRRAKRVRDEVLAKINGLENYEERRILILRYIEGMDWTGINEQLHYSRQHSQRLHQQALLSLSQNETECDKLRQNESLQ